jgi:hypothetical protein
MKKLHYIGFSNQVCSCGYKTVTIDGRLCLIIQQTQDSTTSITNTIETLVSQILATDLLGTDPAELRVFEHYPANMKPIVEWQEVTFEEKHKRKPRRTIVQALVDLVSPTEQPYVVWHPNWYGVSASMQAKLAAEI